MRKNSVALVGLLGLVIASVVFAPQVFAEAYGWSPEVNSGSKKTAACTDEKLKAPILYEPNHPALPRAKGAGQVRLQWTKVPGANGYNVYYGLTPRNYIYSVRDLPDSSDSYTIGGLANRNYYFAVQTKKGCAAGPFSKEWGGRPNGGGFLTAAVGAVPLQRTTTPIKATPAAPLVQPKVQPSAPVVLPAPRTVTPPPAAAPAPTKQVGFFESIGNFFFNLFK